MSPVPTFVGLGPYPTFDDVVRKINKLTGEMQNLMVSLDSLNVVSLTADHVDTGTLDAGVVTIRSDLTGSAFIQLDGTGMTINDGTQDTFAADTNGNVSITGTLTIGSGSSGISNFTDAGALATEDTADFATQVSGAEKPSDFADVTQTIIDGGLITTGTIQLTDGTSTKAGMTAVGVGDSNVRLWAGDTLANRATAPFRVTQGGALVATNATITGAITANSGTIGGWTIESDRLSGTGIIEGGQITGASIISDSTIDVTTDLTVGNNIQIGDPSATGSDKEISFFTGKSLSYDSASGFLGLNGGLLRLVASGASGEIFLTSGDVVVLDAATAVYYGGESAGFEVAVKSQIDSLQTQITANETEIATKADAGVNTDSHIQGDHNHGISAGNFIQLYDSGGSPTTLVEWVPSGGFTHSHSQN